MELTTMFMQGRAGSTVTYVEGEESGIAYARFRLAVPRFRRNDDGEWEELEPKWHTVKAWGELAKNVRTSVSVGEPLIVVGHGRASAWLSKEGEARAEMAIHAVTIGHDLAKGYSRFGRRVPEAQIPDPQTGAAPSATQTANGQLVDKETGEILSADTDLSSAGSEQTGSNGDRGE